MSKIKTLLAILSVGMAVLMAPAAKAANTTFLTDKGQIVFPFSPPKPATGAPANLDNTTIGATTPRPGTFSQILSSSGAATIASGSCGTGANGTVAGNSQAGKVTIAILALLAVAGVEVVAAWLEAAGAASGAWAWGQAAVEAVAGAVKWHKLGRAGLPELASSAALKRAHREQLDHVGMWLEDCCLVGSDGFTPTATLYLSYETWCHRNGYEPKKQRGFANAIVRKGIKTDRRTDCRGFAGIGIKPAPIVTE